MPVFHVETPTDYLFYIADDRQQVISHFKTKKQKINALNQVNEEIYNTLLEIEFIKPAEVINGQ